MNTQLVESLVKAIRALSAEEHTVLEEKPFSDVDGPTTSELAIPALIKGGHFDFLSAESNSYSLEDGELIDVAI